MLAPQPEFQRGFETEISFDKTILWQAMGDPCQLYHIIDGDHDHFHGCDHINDIIMALTMITDIYQAFIAWWQELAGFQSFRRARVCNFLQQKHRFFYDWEKTDNFWLSSKLTFIEISTKAFQNAQKLRQY